MEAHDPIAALEGVPELDLGSGSTTREQAEAAFPMLARFNEGGVFVGRFSGLSPWERHGADEFLHVLEGEVSITLLTEDGLLTLTIPTGSVFVVPRGLWHRQLPLPRVTLLSCTPQPTDVSFAEDPGLLPEGFSPSRSARLA